MTGDLRADLVGALDAQTILLMDPVNERIFRTLIERAGVDPELARATSVLSRESSEPVRAVLRQGMLVGVLPADLDLDFAMDQLAGPLAAHRLLSQLSVDRDYVERVVDGFLRMHPG